MFLVLLTMGNMESNPDPNSKKTAIEGISSQIFEDQSVDDESLLQPTRDELLAELEKKNQIIAQKEKRNLELEKSINQQKKRSLIVFGVPSCFELSSVILQLFYRLMGIRQEQVTIEDSFRIGSNNIKKQRPIVIQLGSPWQKQVVMEKVAMLKGTGYFITHFKTPEELQRENHLRIEAYKKAQELKIPSQLLRYSLKICGKTVTLTEISQQDWEHKYLPRKGNKMALVPSIQTFC